MTMVTFSDFSSRSTWYKLLRAVESEYIPEWVNKTAGGAAFFVVYLYLLAEDVKNGAFRRKKKSVFMEGIPVYDLPQI